MSSSSAPLKLRWLSQNQFTPESLIDSTDMPMPPSYSRCRDIAQDTLQRVETILREVPEGSPDSTFIKKQLPPLRALRGVAASVVVRVVNIDAFTLSREIMNRVPDARGKTAVLNLASDIYRAGGWVQTLSLTQEEALCYASTLYETLKEEYYPWPNLGPKSIAGVYSPAVVIFKDDLDHNCVDLPVEERRVVAVLTVAAPRGPRLSQDRQSFARAEDSECLRGKIRLVYRMAAHNGKEYIVLGAMGCGAYRCPPRQVAEEMKAVLKEPEFKGRFKEIAFAVYSPDTSPRSNFSIFKEVLEGTEI